MGCQCVGEVSLCRMLSEDWISFTEEFGCRIANAYNTLFTLKYKPFESYFYRLKMCYKQFRYLELKDKEIESEIFEFFDQVEQMRSLLKTKWAIKKNVLEPYFRELHETYRNSLKHSKANFVRSIFRRRLRVLSP